MELSKLRFDLVTIFPEFFESPLKISLIGKAIQEQKLEVHLCDLRDFATDKHQSVDDLPYGGGPGMVLKPGPLVAALESIPRQKKSKRILLTPRGKVLDQMKVKGLASEDQLILICGRYEGVDERIKEWIDEELSIGDYILNGGEVAALVLMDSIIRLIPGILGNEVSLTEESFSQGLLEYPQYTRPENFRDRPVPPVLLSGNHAKIRTWRRRMALLKTWEQRPDLLEKSRLTDEEKEYLRSLRK